MATRALIASRIIVRVDAIATRDHFGDVCRCEFWWGAGLTKPIFCRLGVNVLGLVVVTHDDSSTKRLGHSGS